MVISTLNWSIPCTNEQFNMSYTQNKVGKMLDYKLPKFKLLLSLKQSRIVPATKDIQDSKNHNILF